MDAATILTKLVEIWCREHGQELVSIEITEKKHEPTEADDVPV